MAYCPFCDGNYPINMKTQNYTDYEDTTEDTYGVDEYGSYSEFDKISTTHKSTPVNRAYSYEVCSNCSRKLEFPYATTRAQFVNCEKKEFENLKRNRLSNLKSSLNDKPEGVHFFSKVFALTAVFVPMFFLCEGAIQYGRGELGASIFFGAIIIIIYLYLLFAILQDYSKYKRNLKNFHLSVKNINSKINKIKSLEYTHENYIYLQQYS